MSFSFRITFILYSYSIQTKKKKTKKKTTPKSSSYILHAINHINANAINSHGIWVINNMHAITAISVAVFNNLLPVRYKIININNIHHILSSPFWY